MHYDADVIVIGSGAGGIVAAKELGEKRVKVLVPGMAIRNGLNAFLLGHPSLQVQYHVFQTYSSTIPLLWINFI